MKFMTTDLALLTPLLQKCSSPASEQMNNSGICLCNCANCRGYSRHAVAWKRSNGDWNAIIDEVPSTCPPLF